MLAQTTNSRPHSTLHSNRLRLAITGAMWAPQLIGTEAHIWHRTCIRCQVADNDPTGTARSLPSEHKPKDFQHHGAYMKHLIRDMVMVEGDKDRIQHNCVALPAHLKEA